MKITNIQTQQINNIFKKYSVEFAYIFGSFVNGNTVKTSDIDIAVFLKQKNKLKRFDIRLKLMTELSKIFRKEVDLTVINDITSIFFKYIIVTEGILIFESNKGLRIDTESMIYSEYFDFKPFLEEYNKNFINKKIYATA